MPKKYFFYTLLSLILALLLIYYLKNIQNTASAPISAQQTNQASPSGQLTIGIQTKTTDCQIRGPLPDPDCTPGQIIESATKEQICVPGYTKSVRNVPQSEKEKVFSEYGITNRQPGEFEVDHLISLELGGSNGIANLFPEAAQPRPGFHEKDKLENYLHDQVCNDAISLSDAQLQIAHDWLYVYQKMLIK